jgi:hypothetical protein
MVKNPDIGLFQNSTPRTDRCCLCEQPGGPFHLEQRPTALAGAMQTWSYCGLCWLASQASCADLVGYRVLLYAIFGDPRRFRPLRKDGNKNEIDNNKAIMQSCGNETTNCGLTRGNLPGVEAAFCCNGCKNGGCSSETPAGLSGESIETTEEINPHGAGLPTGETADKPLP